MLLVLGPTSNVRVEPAAAGACRAGTCRLVTMETTYQTAQPTNHLGLPNSVGFLALELQKAPPLLWAEDWTSSWKMGRVWTQEGR